MKIVAFFSQKGGSGKTTLAVHAAVAAQESGERVVLMDIDPQKSTATWGAARGKDTNPTVITIDAAEVDDAMKAARHDAVTLCILDTAPHASPDASRAAKVADLVVIPCRPTAFDTAAAPAAVEIVRAAGKPAVFVLSACPFRAREIAESRELLKTHGLPIAPVEITDRRAFARAIATGRAVTEFDSEGKAAHEIRALWKWLREQLAYGNKTDRVGGVRAKKHARA